MKNKELKREEYITGLLDFTVTGVYLMEGDASRKLFDFEMSVPTSTIRPTTINTWDVTNFQ